MVKKYMTSESVTEGHPDKICDQISDAILDELLRQDPNSRVAVECLTTTGIVICAGEVTTKGFVDVQKTVRDTLRDIGYTDPEYGIDCQDAGVLVSIHEQSPNIALGVDERKGKEQGAGDQGMMYGYATNETPELMPLPIMLAHRLAQKLSEVRKNKTLPYLGPDGKSQVSLEYENDRPKRITTIVIAAQHKNVVDEHTVYKDVLEHVIKPVCAKWMDYETKIHVNATGKFVIGGPEGDTGVTGRKIIVDTYGSVGRHGGGCFSGKDPSKVDRSGAYAARWVAKNIVAAGLADKCEIQISYCIGIAQPVSINVETFGTAKIPEEKIIEIVKKNFKLTPQWIIETLKLKRPIYKKTAVYGHFGRNDPDFTWEKTDMAELLKKESRKYSKPF
ncbi:MAG: methionine adenosyltransferase [Candidatus Micrarchaeota archaeon]